MKKPIYLHSTIDFWQGKYWIDDVIMENRHKRLKTVEKAFNTKKEDQDYKNRLINCMT